MILSVGDILRGAPAAKLDIVLFIRSIRNIRIHDIGNGQERIAEFGGQRPLFMLQRLHFLLKLTNLCHHCMGCGFIARRLSSTNFF